VFFFYIDRLFYLIIASGGSLFYLYILWQIFVPCPTSGGTLFDRKKGGKTTKGAAAPLETPLVRNGALRRVLAVRL